MSLKHKWFAPWGWIHRPTALPGWLALALCLAFCVQAFLAVDRGSHSASDTLYGVFPFVAPALLLLDWLARRTSAAK